MSSPITLQVEMPEGMEQFRLPEGVNLRLQILLDKQDEGSQLTHNECKETEGLVALSKWLSLLRLQSQRLSAECKIIKIAVRLKSQVIVRVARRCKYCCLKRDKRRPST